MVFFTQITMEAAEDPEFLDAMRRAHIKGALVGVEVGDARRAEGRLQGLQPAPATRWSTRLQHVPRARRARARLVHLRPAERSRRRRSTRRVALAERAGRHVRAVRDADAVPRHARLREVGEDARRPSRRRSDGVPITRHWLIPQAQRPEGLHRRTRRCRPTRSATRTQGVWDRVLQPAAHLGARRACVKSLQGAAGVRADLEALSADVRQHRHRHRQRARAAARRSGRG